MNTNETIIKMQEKIESIKNYAAEKANLVDENTKNKM